MGFASLLASPLAWAAGCIFIALAFARRGWARRLLAVYESVLRRLPGFREVFQAMFLTQFCRSMALQLRAGLGLLESLQRATVLSDDPAIRERGQQMMVQLMDGLPLSQCLTKAGLFPRLLVCLVRVGEETGELERIFFQLVEFYQDELNQKIDGALALLEPVLIMFVGLVTGVCLLVTMYPMVKAIESL